MKKEINLRVWVAATIMIVMFVKVMLYKPERQIELAQVPQNFAGLEISPVAAVSLGLIVIALATLAVHVLTAEKRSIDNI